MGDYYLQTWCIRVVSRLAERLKTYDFTTYEESVQTAWNDSTFPSSPAKTKALVILAENP